MLYPPSRCLALVTLLGAACCLPAVEPEAPPAEKVGPPLAPAAFEGSRVAVQTPGASRATAEPRNEPTPPAKKPDHLPLPAGAIVVAGERMAEALQLVPESVILSREKYAALVAENKRLKEQLDGLTKCVTPSGCSLRGKVEGSVVLLQAQFDFATQRPDTMVSLACGQGQPTAASLDGHTPLLRNGTGGFSVQVDKAGDHQLTLDLLVPLASQGNSQGFVLDLPRAAITRLELDLPPGVKEPRLGNRPVGQTLLALKGRQLAGGLGPGPADKLELSWKGARGSPNTPPVLTADGQVEVRLDPGGTTTTARLTLNVQGGQADQWRLLVPPKAEIRAEPGSEGRIQSVQADDKKYPRASLRTLRLKEAGSAPLTVVVTAHGPLPRPGAPVPVGPFVVLGALRQSGGLLVSNAVADLHLDYRPHGDMKRRVPSDEERRRDPGLTAAFQYLNVPTVESPRAASLSWLDLDGETIKGRVKTRLAHALTLGRDGPDGELLWRVATTVEATPQWTDVDVLRLKMPGGCEFTEDSVVSTPAAKVQHVEYDRVNRVVQFRLAKAPGEASLKPFLVTLEGRYPELREPTGRAVLGLPQPEGTADQGGQVTVHVPKDLELLPPESGAPALELIKQGAHEQTWRARHTPERAEVSWRPYQPEVRVSSLVDLDLGLRQGRVRQRLQFQFTQSPPSQVALFVPEGAADGLAVVEGGTLSVTRGVPAAPGRGVRGAGEVRLVNLPAGVGTKHVIRLEYDFRPLGQFGEPIVVPLVVPQQVSQGETKVRVWGEAGVLPALEDKRWGELNVEEVAGRPRLPSLVLRVQRVDLPLRLQLGERPAAFTVLVQRALVQAEVLEGGGQEYRARFLLGQLTARHLDVELPGPVPALGLRVWLDGKQVTPAAVDENGQPADGGHVARLRLGPDLVRESSVLEVTYQLPPGRAGGGLLRTTLQPPVVRGDPGRVPTRWQVTLPPDWVAVGPEGGPGSGRSWGRRGWLLAPHLTVTAADLDRWFAGPGGSAGGESVLTPSVVCWREGCGPLAVTHVPQRAWLLVCSLGLLVVGLLLYWLARAGDGVRSNALWPALALLALGGAVAGLLWPTAVAAVAYGCEPGAAVLLLFAAAQWLLHQRYRRQVIFLPSFSRGRSGSSLVRGSSASRPRGEPSTVDAPQPAASSTGKYEGPGIPGDQSGQ